MAARGVTYTLTDEDLAEVEAHTRQIIAYNTRKGYRDNWATTPEQDYELKFNGFAAELAASRVTGLSWRKTMFGSGFKERKACDLGNRTEVRNTHHEHGSLPFKPKDDPASVYVLVIGVSPTYRVVGWMEGEDLVKLPVRTDIPYPARFADQSLLSDLPLPRSA